MKERIKERYKESVATRHITWLLLGFSDIRTQETELLHEFELIAFSL